MQRLKLHEESRPGPVTNLTAEIRPNADGFDVRFFVQGDIAKLHIPQAAGSGRADDLWQTTCFEVFWHEVGAPGYREFNLSPSGQWAAYDFSDYRQKAGDAQVDNIAMSTSHSAANGTGEVQLHAQVASPLDYPAMIGLTAVIELNDGTMQHWALEFADGKPDFHDAACRTLTIERP